MAYADICFKHPHTGEMRSAPVGFSWTALFFNFFPALFRRHWLAAFFILILTLIISDASAHDPDGSILYIVYSIILGFFYNKFYITHLLKKGYKVESASHDLEYLARQLNLHLPKI